MGNIGLTTKEAAALADEVKSALATIANNGECNIMHIKDARAAVTKARILVAQALDALITVEASFQSANRYEKPLKGTQANPDKQQIKNPAPSKGS